MGDDCSTSWYRWRCSLSSQPDTNDELWQVVRLERENARLQKLITELLIKNEQLRQMFVASLEHPAVPGWDLVDSARVE
jgi:hypothetical protein